MIFTETPLKDVFVIEIKKLTDERGFFARSWDKKIFEQNKLNSNLVQCNISFNAKKGTIRGMHFQKAPHEESKLVRCVKGSVYEVAVDLRVDSKTYLQWFGITLSSENLKMLYVPEGFALGFQTLEDNTELFYQMSHEYVPQSSNGIRWNDPKLNICWPLTPTIISEKDKQLQFVK
ncbi:dTDP-4-dehydrorhamnose 3,5-epimerase [Nitrosopumilus piranensis]|uniref:dTDP-4-dehydrorhamnose 3,5-epimerase n=1 Tax=Nitrosopumilus piranensis TaxID=1582439 RepID=A0A0C5BSJ3_9ARCH|nr:dTDP-4-dehydrorhamnose 3,5-epimerase [Nitrosopumilus piranensis]AJM91281.1 dTDP-4-dehydrorhamnose 3,5-epimerase [Nitrosopumilus piranensis]